MIYQLLRRDPAWRLMPFAAAAGGLCMWANSGVMGLSLFATIMIVWPLLAAIQRRATLFQAALPIPARALFAARCAAFTALVWLPLLAAAGVAYLKGGLEWKTSVLVLTDFGAAATLTLIALLSMRLMEIESPPQLVIPQCYLGGGVCAAAFLVLPAAPVLAVCAIASAALFVRAWRAVPESFQMAPIEAQAPSRQRRAKGAPAVPWLVMLRSAVPLHGLGFLPLIWQTLFTHAASWPGVCCFGIFASGLLQPNTRWMQALPIARRKLLAIAVAMATVMVAAPYTVSVAFGWGGRSSFRLGLINVVCILLVCMSELMLWIAWGSYRVRRLPAWVRRSVFIPVGVVMLLGYPAVALIPGHGSSGHLMEAFMLHLSQWLPENTAAIFALGVIASAAMFRLLEKLDAQAEWPELFGGPRALY